MHMYIYYVGAAQDVYNLYIITPARFFAHYGWLAGCRCSIPLPNANDIRSIKYILVCTHSSIGIVRNGVKHIYCI